MITINETFDIVTGTAPYIYTWTFDKPCVEVGQVTGTTDNILSASFTSEESCFPYIATLNLRDVNGCNSSVSYTYNSPCSTFTISEIAKNGNTYSINITGGLAPFTYEWIYNEDLYNAAILDNSARFTPKPTTPSQEFNVSVRVTDSKGCVRVVSGNFEDVNEVITVTSDVTLIATCRTDAGGVNQWVAFLIVPEMPEGIANVNITPSIFTSTSFAPVRVRIGGNNLQGYPAGSYNFTVILTSNNGVVSNPIVVTIIVPDCTELQDPEIIIE
jgi:hypothetical protein